MSYGLPYQGSKSAIADWVIGVLPASHTLVDLFAGGCAVTHAALASGKFDHVMANDLTPAPRVFLAAIEGDFEGYATVPNRGEFFDSDDIVMRLLYSFGNDKSTYLWSAETEELKIAASRMLSAPSMHERRMYFKEFCDRLARGGGLSIAWSTSKAFKGSNGCRAWSALRGCRGLTA